MIELETARRDGSVNQSVSGEMFSSQSMTNFLTYSLAHTTAVS